MVHFTTLFVHPSNKLIFLIGVKIFLFSVLRSLFTWFCRNNFFEILPPFSYTFRFYATFLCCWSVTVLHRKFDKCLFELHCKRSFFFCPLCNIKSFLLFFVAKLLAYLESKLSFICFNDMIAVSKLVRNAKSSIISRTISPVCAKIVLLLLRSFHVF